MMALNSVSASAQNGAAIIPVDTSDQATFTSTESYHQNNSPGPFNAPETWDRLTISLANGTQISGKGHWANGAFPDSNFTGGWNATDGGNVTVPQNAAIGPYTLTKSHIVWTFNPVTYVKDSDSTTTTYSFNVVKLNITGAGTPGINPMTGLPYEPPKVMVGQKVTLSANVAGLTGITPAPTLTYSWTVGGDNIKEFKITPWTPPSAPGVTPVVNEVKPSGHKVAFDADGNDKVYNPSLYFTKGSLTGTPASVSCTATVNGKTLTANGSVNVLSPEFVSFTSQWSSLNPPWGLTLYNTDGTGLAYHMMLGELHSETEPAVQRAKTGIIWSSQIKIPSIGSGQLTWIQLTKTLRTFEVPANTNPVPPLDSGAYILDGPADVAVYHPSFSVSPGTTGLSPVVSDSDSPAQKIAGTTSSVLDDKFDLYLVYRPNTSNSIWITLGLLHWDANATSSGSAVTGIIPSVGGAGPIGSSYTELPDWSDSEDALKARTYTTPPPTP